MDKLTHYHSYLQDIITEYSQHNALNSDVEREAIFDTTHDHYQLMAVGWNKYQRIHATLLHVDIRNGKIWVQYDGTEEGIANRLVDLGVPREDIVLAFHPPYKRPHTNFAVG